MAISAPFLPYSALRQVADEFLNEYHSSRAIPVPIERIIELEFEIDIVPMPGLHDNFDIDSFPTSDLREIRVDEFVYRNREGRYRFSLAHELSHLLLHKDVFSQLAFSSLQEWKVAVASIHPNQYQWIEWQAYALGGLILVPPGNLNDVFEDVSDTARSAGVSLDNPSDEVMKLIEGQIAREFNVSRAVVMRRMKSDGLWTKQ